MNRKRCLFCLVLLTLLFLPALAMGEPTPEPLFQAFEAAAPPTGELMTPEPVFANHCNAQQTCANQCVASCTGHINCTVQSTSVTCDGVTTSCPYPTCTPSSICASVGLGCEFCACKAQGFGNFYCAKHVGCIDPPDPS